MAIKQVSVFAENRAGGILDVIRTLGYKGVDIRALSIAENQEFGILRLIVSDNAKATEVLGQIGSVYSLTDVIGVKIPNTPGGLTSILSILAESNINVEYLYAFVAATGANAYVVLRVADNAQAEQILADKGIEMITEDEVSAL